MTVEMDGASRRRAFTLIELLVVVAILATLASIMFPVFLSARESGRQTQCLNNLRTIGSAFSLYLNDWNDFMPPTTGGAHLLLLNRYIKAPIPLDYRAKTATTVWQCPSMPKNVYSTITNELALKSGAVWPWAPEKVALVRNSYLVNADACMDNDRNVPRRLNDIRSTSQIILMTESCHGVMTTKSNRGQVPCTVQPTLSGNAVSGWCSHVDKGSKSLVHPYHNLSANFLYCDMHAVNHGFVPPLEHWNQKYIPRNPER